MQLTLSFKDRGQFFGDRMSYIMERPEHSPNTVVRIAKDGKTVMDSNGYPEGDVSLEAYAQPDHFERLPAPLRVKTGHGNSHTFITNEFVSAIVEVIGTAPGILATQ